MTSIATTALPQITVERIQIENDKVTVNAYLTTRDGAQVPYFMNEKYFSDFIKTYSDIEIKTYIDLSDNFLFNVNLFMNNVENKEVVIIKLIKKYQKKEYKEYYRKKVNRKISGRSKYNLDDVIIFSEVFECSPSLLLFGVQ